MVSVKASHRSLPPPYTLFPIRSELIEQVIEAVFDFLICPTLRNEENSKTEFKYCKVVNLFDFKQGVNLEYFNYNKKVKV